MFLGWQGQFHRNDAADVQSVTAVWYWLPTFQKWVTYDDICYVARFGMREYQTTGTVNWLGLIEEAQVKF